MKNSLSPADRHLKSPTETVPEKRMLFEPGGIQYSANFRPGSAHEKVADLIDRTGSQRVLDCGCVDGSFGEHLMLDGTKAWLVPGGSYLRIQVC